MIEYQGSYHGYPPLEYAWIYVAIDARDMSICKVGITRAPNSLDRFSSTTINPFYIAFNFYNLGMLGASDKELRDFERYIHRKLGPCLTSLSSGNNTEWVNCPPTDAVAFIEESIAKGFAGRNFIDEDGEINYAEVHKIREQVRPMPLGAAFNGNRMIDDYLHFLENWHEENTPYYKIKIR